MTPSKLIKKKTKKKQQENKKLVNINLKSSKEGGKEGGREGRNGFFNRDERVGL